MGASIPNYTMLSDFYETDDGQRLLCKRNRRRNRPILTCFSAVCRTAAAFAITAGLQQVVEYIQNLHFTEEDIAFLRSKNLFSEDFLSYLRSFRFTGDIYAIPEGTPVFPGERS